MLCILLLRAGTAASIGPAIEPEREKTLDALSEADGDARDWPVACSSD